MLKGLLAFDASEGKRLWLFHKETQNAASHATYAVTTHYFEAYQDGLGVHFDPHRRETYVRTAEDLVSLAGALERALSRATEHLESRLNRAARRRIAREWGKKVDA